MPVPFLSLPPKIKPGRYLMIVQNFDTPSGTVTRGHFFPENAAPAQFSEDELLIIGVVLAQKLVDVQHVARLLLPGRLDPLINLQDKINAALKTLQPPKKAVSSRPRKKAGRSKGLRPATAPARRRKA